MIYLIHENEDLNEINLIYYVEPPKYMSYKAIDEKDMPEEREGFYRKLFYDKKKNKVYAEYEEIIEEKSEIDLLRDELENTKLELSLALVELTEQLNLTK